MKDLPRYSVGYTLIEILVGLTIVGLLFGAGYASFRSFSRRQVVLDASKSIQGDLRLAQQVALSGQKPSDPKCNAPNTLDGYNFRVVSASRYRIQANCSGGLVTTKDITLSPDLNIVIAPAAQNPITFKILGTGTNIPVGLDVTISITQSSTGNATSITLTSGGQIETTQPTGAPGPTATPPAATPTPTPTVAPTTTPTPGNVACGVSNICVTDYDCQAGMVCKLNQWNEPMCMKSANVAICQSSSTWANCCTP